MTEMGSSGFGSADRDVWLLHTLEHAATGVAICDLEGRIVEVNKNFCASLGHTRVTIDATSIFDLMHATDRFALRPRVEEMLSGKAVPFTAEHRFVHVNGSPVWVRSSLSTSPKVQNSPPRLISLSEDLSLRKRAEKAMRENEAMALIGRLAASIVHEINNPLESVVNLHYLAMRSDDLEQTRRYIKMAEDETARISRIALQTLRFHRKTATAEICYPVDLVDTVLELFRQKLKRQRIEVQMETEDTPKFQCLDGEIRQVIANLVGNAADAMPMGGILHVRVRPATDWRDGKDAVRITVADTGSGISPKVRKQIFDPFFTTKGAVGSGIGLWLSADIIAKHHGTVRVRSSTEAGRSGTAFTLLLPCDGISRSGKPS